MDDYRENNPYATVMFNGEQALGYVRPGIGKTAYLKIKEPETKCIGVCTEILNTSGHFKHIQGDTVFYFIRLMFMGDVGEHTYEIDLSQIDDVW